MSVANWVDERFPTDRVHLDAAAAGRASSRVLELEREHLEAEAVMGAYVAEAAAQDQIDAGRSALAALVGLDDAFYADGAGTAFATLLDAWPLPSGSRIGTIPGEYGGNARFLRDRASMKGWQLVSLPVDGLGRILVVPADLDLVTFPQILSQRGIAQPVELALASGVPLVLDVAQSAGQVEVPRGAAAYVGTSRKWLCGPRGVGWGCVAPSWVERLKEPPTLGPAHHPGRFAMFDTPEPHVAGRIGLAHAARTWSPALLPVVHAGAAAARVLLEGGGDWRVIEPVEEPTGITTLRHQTADPGAVRARLIEKGFVVSVVPTSRADDMTGPVLRVSTAAWVTPGDLESLAGALESLGSTA
ncbi:MAG: ergothioneine biosynthesis PLP-dependent enzyme EgtE [Mycobacteriales bacterium]